MRVALAVTKQLIGGYAERIGERLDDIKARVSVASLDCHHVGPVQAGLLGEEFLRPTALGA